MVNETGVTIHAMGVPRPPAPFINETDRLRVLNGVFERNSGHSVFKANYDQAASIKTNIKDIDWYNFTFHDALSPLSKYSAFTIGDSTIGDAMHRFNSAKKLEDKLSLLESLVALDLPDIKGFPAEYSDHIKGKVMPLKKLFPLFKPSIQFLLHPNGQTYKDMNEFRISARDIIDTFALPQTNITGNAERMLNGFEGIILFNMLKNAEAHSPYLDTKIAGYDTHESDPSHIRLEMGEIGFTVHNHSNDADPGSDTLFHFKGKGKSGNTGFGMFTAAKLYAPLIGSGMEAEWAEHEADDKTKYSVRFSIKKSLPVSSESPLPQPAQ